MGLEILSGLCICPFFPPLSRFAFHQQALQSLLNGMLSAKTLIFLGNFYVLSFTWTADNHLGDADLSSLLAGYQHLAAGSLGLIMCTLEMQ